MFKLYSTTICLLAAICLSAQTDHTITTQGLTYSPADLTVQVGDNITLSASSTHPAREVSEDTWNANGTEELAGGFGTQSSTFTFTVTEPGTIYYVCTAHAGQGMKGLITVNPVGVDDLGLEIEVDLGQMPITDGSLEYTISSSVDVAHLQIISLNGQKVAEQRVEGDTGILYFNLPVGMYVAILTDRNGGPLYRETISVK